MLAAIRSKKVYPSELNTCKKSRAAEETGL